MPGQTGRQVALADLVPLLSIVPRLDVTHAIALVRAAVAYEEALWSAEADPVYSWLKLVSAIEAAARTRNNPGLAAEEMLRQLKPELADRLAGLDSRCVQLVADELSPTLRVTWKFISFLTEFAPGPPSERPPDPYRLDWTHLEDHFRAVYAYRSKNLHEAAEFPVAMTVAPMTPDGTPMEIWPGPDGDFMLLHTFARIVGEALRKWWMQIPGST